MRDLPQGATDYTPPAAQLAAGTFRGTALRHTYRRSGSEDWLLCYTLAGEGLICFPGGSRRLEAHSFLLYRPGVFQDYRRAPGSSRWEVSFAHFLPRPGWLAWLTWPEVAPGTMVLEIPKGKIRRRILERLEDMVRYSRGSGPLHLEFGANALEEILLWSDSVNPRRQGFDARIQKAVDFLSRDLAAPFSEDDLSRRVGLSPSRFRHLFRQQTGETSRNFQERLRLREAKSLLLLSNLSIGEIAAEIGFENPFYFTLRFKKDTGRSPTDFRRSAGRALA